MAPRAPRTPAQNLAALVERRRLEALDRALSQDRIWALDTAIHLLRTGRKLKPCPLEDIDPEQEAAS